MSRLTQVAASPVSAGFAYGAITLYGRPFQDVPLPARTASPAAPTTPGAASKPPRFGLLRVRSPLLAESLLFSFPPGTEMFQFPGLAPGKTAGWHGRPCRVAPFGHPRIGGYLLLPAAFRSLSRPSSPPVAKASFMCPFFLSLVSFCVL